MTNVKFATAINCIDGRTQLPVIEHIKKRYGVDFVDMITLPGPDKVLAESKEISTLESIKKYVEISRSRHGSTHVAICGHYDCAGNPVDMEIHIKQLKEAKNVLKSWFPELKVVGLWINQSWEIEEVS